MENREGAPVTLLELQRQLMPLSPHWYQIGLGANLPRSRLRLLDQFYRKSHKESLRRLCVVWVEAEPELTWEEVVGVLRGRQLESLAGEVAQEIQWRLCLPDPGETADRSTDSQSSVSMVGRLHLFHTPFPKSPHTIHTALMV